MDTVTIRYRAYPHDSAAIPADQYDPDKHELQGDQVAPAATPTAPVTVAVEEDDDGAV